MGSVNQYNIKLKCTKNKKRTAEKTPVKYLDNAATKRCIFHYSRIAIGPCYLCYLKYFADSSLFIIYAYIFFTAIYYILPQGLPYCSFLLVH